VKAKRLGDNRALCEETSTGGSHEGDEIDNGQRGSDVHGFAGGIRATAEQQ